MLSRRSILPAVAAAIGLALPWPAAQAGPLEDGEAAYAAEEFEAAVSLWTPLAEQGDPAAQFYLGLVHSLGQGVGEDDAEAVRWYRLAADQGDAMSQFRLGLHLSTGEGVAEDDVEAVRWYRAAAEQGIPVAQLSLAVHYFRGEGVRQNTIEAFAWATVSAARGNPRANRFGLSLGENLTQEEIDQALELARTYWERYVAPFLN